MTETCRSRPRRKLFVVVTAMCLALSFPRRGADGGTDEIELPPPAAAKVDFHTQIAPIFARSCVKCHGQGKAEGGFRIDTRQSVLAGGDSGAAVELGHSAGSLLIHLVAGLDADRVMPQQGPMLTAEQVGLLRAWIDAGLDWEEGFTFARQAPAAALEPRRVEIPPLPEGETAEETVGDNPVDRFVYRYAATRDIQLPEPVDDRTFARRAYLDVIGLPPSPAQLHDFLSDDTLDRRALLVDRLLANRRGYAIHWLSFWNDALRNDYQGTGYIDGGRRQITDWLFRALSENKPYDRFVHELTSAAPGAEGFTAGIVWRGVVNASQVPEVQAAQNVSQVFLGVNLKCASCHDSFINDWKLTDAYALASVFAESQLQLHRCDKPTGQFVEPAFLYPQLGNVDPDAPRDQRVRQLADIITDRRNGRLARTIVNRLWGRLFGRALVEPVDEMDNPPWDADVLDWLAADLADHDYDLKHTLRLILNSRAYALPATGLDEADEAYVFRGPAVRRLSAEQFVDAVSQLTGVWYPAPAVQLPEVESTGEATIEDTSTSENPTRVRAALVVADALQRALGRPNREQIVTSRPQAATTLEALELTNGAVLAERLREGARRVVEGTYGTSDELVADLYVRAIARKPTAGEGAAAIDLVGSPATAQGVEDLLWILVMLPEFQLIY